MEKKKHIIIGSGTAAISALKQMRKTNTTDEVKMVTMEPHLPYSPTSLPYLISGKIKESEIAMTTSDFFKQMNASWASGKRVEHLDTKKGEIIYESHERDSYDSLLIATGSEPSIPNIPGLNANQVFQLRTLDDAQKLTARMKASRTAIILGAGLIGMHVAECLAEKGINVTVIEMLPQILPAYFDPDASMMIQRVLEKHGIALLTNHRATGVSWKGNGVEVATGKGEILRADLLLVATGVKPRTSFLNGSGIKIDDGILVDREMKTSIANIFAAGDVASAKSFLTGENGINPILPNAAEQGKVAGSNMAGQKMDYEGWLPMNTFNFFGHLAVSVGKAMPSGGDEVLTEKDDDKGCYKKIICKEDRLLGATFLDTDVNAGVFQYLIKRRVGIGNHKKMLISAPREASMWLMQEAEKKETISMEE